MLGLSNTWFDLVKETIYAFNEVADAKSILKCFWNKEVWA